MQEELYTPSFQQHVRKAEAARRNLNPSSQDTLATAIAMSLIGTIIFIFIALYCRQVAKKHFSARNASGQNMDSTSLPITESRFSLETDFSSVTNGNRFTLSANV